jgi:hypothetical protein
MVVLFCRWPAASARRGRHAQLGLAAEVVPLETQVLR